MKILIVEDEEPKLKHICKFLEQLIPDADLHESRSVRSALLAFETETYDLIILDMSLPTFDVSGVEPGGRPQGFGGTDLMRELDLCEKAVPVIVLTGYEAFTKAGGELGLAAMHEELAEEFPDFFCGILHFNSAYGDWQVKLAELINLHARNAQ